MSYPKVANEYTTMEMLQAGRSIARFGDGEFKMMDGAGYVREPPNRKLAAEMRAILRYPHKNCLVAIPTMDPRGPKIASWKRHTDRFARLLKNAPGPLYSAFISRPDSAPWIRTREFAEQMQSLWAGKRVWVLCEKGGSTIRAVKPAAATTIYERCPHKEAYQFIDIYEKEAVAEMPDIAILSCGMTATCLANRLSAHGIQAIDFGSAGAFIAKMLQ
jgi:hypothetical protein